MRALIASPDKDEAARIKLAVEQAGADCLGYAISADSLVEKITAFHPDLVILRMDLVRRGDEEIFMSELGAPAMVILPRGRAYLRDKLLAHPNVRAVELMSGPGENPVDYARLLASVAGRPATAQPASSSARSDPGQATGTSSSGVQMDVRTSPPYPASAAHPSRRRATCLLFAGVKGGVGVTTSLCALAVAAAGLKLKVGVVDLTDTGDVQATLPKNSPVRILELDRAALVAQWPRLRIEHDLLLVDGGRLPALALGAVGATLVCVTRADTTDRLPGDAGWVLVADAARAPVGLKAVAVFPPEPELFAQIERGDFLQPGPLLVAATTWAGHLRRAERHAEVRA